VRLTIGCRPSRSTQPDLRSAGKPHHILTKEEPMFGIIGWTVFGLIVGILAKLVMPGRDPGGFIITALLGIAGAVVGGFVGRTLGFYGPGEAAGFLMSFVGAVLLLAVYHKLRPAAS
jgi:uncharacterized membrane protein YeaQ/YmgE (transglycosylase-associated protein family)